MAKAKAIERKSMEKETSIRVGNQNYDFVELSEEEVAIEDDNIQREVEPVYYEIRKTRKAAAITASKIVLNA